MPADRSEPNYPDQAVAAHRQLPRRLPITFLAIAMLVGVACPLAVPMDGGVSTALRQWDLPGDLQKAITLSEAFAHGFGVTCILLSIFVVATRRRKAVWIAVLLTLASGATANLLKATIVRVRPHAEGLQVQGTPNAAESSEAVERSYWDARQRSFPSGHAATAWGLAIGLSLLFPRATLIFILLAVLACIQRSKVVRTTRVMSLQEQRSLSFSLPASWPSRGFARS